MNLLPNAKTANIVVQELNNETLIYNLKTNQALCLNEMAGKVFNHCDGQTTFDELKEKYQLPADIILLALDELHKQDLIADDYVSPFTGMSRREVIHKIGLASMIALPVISAMIAPHPAHAASQTFTAGSRNVNESCNTSTDCNQADAQNCVTVRGQSSTGKACCRNNTAQPVFLTGGDPNGGATVNYTSQAACVNAVSPQCCSRMVTCNCTQIANGSFSCRSVCQ